MRYKQEISKHIEQTLHTLEILIREIESGKPHVTREYLSSQLEVLHRSIDRANQYLILENE